MKMGNVLGVIFAFSLVRIPSNWLSNQSMSANPTFTPNSFAMLPSAAGTTIVCTGATLGVPNSTWYPGAADTSVQKLPRWKASSYCVVPRSVPSGVTQSIFWKMGDPVVLLTAVRPFESLVSGLKVVVVVPLLYDNAIGIMNTGTVVDLPVVGAVPTIVYL